MDRVEKTVRNSIDAHPLKQALAMDHHYYYDFVRAANDISDGFTHKEMRKFIGKFQLGNIFDIWQYLQSAIELTVLEYIKRKFDHGFQYEPKYNDGKNPECTFLDNGIQINVEVKCPNLQKRIEQESSLKQKILLGDRIPGLGGVGNKVKDIFYEQGKETPFMLIDRLDSKLQSYLKSAQDKFPDSTDTNFNVLVISGETLNDMDELYTGLFGLEGVFTNNSFAKFAYDRIDAVMLSNILAGHCRWEQEKNNVWQLEQYLNLLLLNPDKENTMTGTYYFARGGATLFGETICDFFNFQKILDKEDTEKGVRIEETLFKQSMIITLFGDYLQSQN